MTKISFQYLPLVKMVVIEKLLTIQHEVQSTKLKEWWSPSQEEGYLQRPLWSGEDHYKHSYEAHWKDLCSTHKHYKLISQKQEGGCHSPV